MKRIVVTNLTIALALALAACGGERSPAGSSLAATSAPSATTTPAAYPAGSSNTPAPPGRGPHFVELPAESGLLDAIRAEARAASGAGETLVLYVGARWCKPCLHFEQALASGKHDEALAGLRLLHVDLDARGPELAAQGYATNVIPYFVVPTPKGTPSARKFSTSTMGREVVEQIVAGLAPFRPER
jgi:hypothetical protein